MSKNTTCCYPPQYSGWDWFPTTPPCKPGCADVIGAEDEQECIADWQFTDTGAFAGNNALHSAVIMQLFTDKRLADDQDITVADPFERGGWWGDFFAPFEMGSHLWTLYRETLNDKTLSLARRYIREALQPLLDQGAAVRQETIIDINKTNGHLIIVAKLYGKDGSTVYDQQFSRVWGE